VSCGKDGDDPDPIATVFPPSASVLIFPNNNEECNTGESIDVDQSKVKFRWNAAANTTEYTIFLKNLLINEEKNFSTTNEEIELNILKNTPYQWWVISKSDTSPETAKSSEWKFYNSGDATITYAPFPAELVAPLMNAEIDAITVTLEWKGADVDSDLESFDVYFGTEQDPAEKLTTQSTEKIENVDVLATTTYFWFVVSVDSKGNTSTSQEFRFKVK
jgi:hypothetical protein